MDGPTTREASHQDAERLVAVYRSAYRENPELGFPAKAERVTVDDDPRVAGREPGLRRQGRSDGARERPDGGDEPERVRIDHHGVHEDWIGDGIGTAPLDHVERVASSASFGSTWLTTPVGHPSLADRYRRRGFERTGDYPLDSPDDDEIVLEKRFDGVSGDG